nr:protein PRD1 [Tanacetum cinerariifolium]
MMEQRKRKEPKKLEHNANYLQSITCVLQGFIFYSDIRVAVNCALCIAMALDWENYVQKDNWYRLIIEEMVMNLAVPSLESKPIMTHHRPAVHIAVSMLELQQVPSWMSAVFDDSCISGIIQNLSPGNITREMVLLFWEFLQPGNLNSKHIACLN